MSRKVKIAGACLNQTPIDWEGNTENIANAIKTAASEKVDILCLPELCITGYGCEDLFLSQWLPETAMEYLLKLVPKTSGIGVAIGLPIRHEGLLYNTTCFIADKQIVGIYAKQLLANDGVHYEPRWFAKWPANKVVNLNIEGNDIPFGHITIEYKNVSIGFEICEDAWQDNRPCSLMQEKVDLVLNPSASHFAFKKASFREHLVTSSSKAFDCVYLYTNLLGNEAGRMIYDGDVLVANRGELIGRNKRLSFKPYNLLSVDVDFDTLASSKQVADDYLNENEEFAHAASLALFDYLRKSRSNGFVLSLSGGADSSTIAALVRLVARFGIDQLGKKAFSKMLNFSADCSDEEIMKRLLVTAYQGTQNSSLATLQSAKQLAKSLGATFYEWTIDDEVDHYRETIEKAIGRPLTWAQDDITLQNIQARSRAPIIWMLANINNALLLATSNRSEGDVGYATMDGDTSGSISPIAGVSKQFILQWLQYAQYELGFDGLQYVNALTPTAELRPGEQKQTDEDDLMPYPILQEIERAAIFQRKSPRKVLEALSGRYDEEQLKGWVRKFFQLWTRNQWKRERYAPSFHFDDFNIDPRSWCRFPILSGGFKKELDQL